jgi:outer membrane protein assembly factor BamB
MNINLIDKWIEIKSFNFIGDAICYLTYKNEIFMNQRIIQQLPFPYSGGQIYCMKNLIVWNDDGKCLIFDTKKNVTIFQHFDNTNDYYDIVDDMLFDDCLRFSFYKDEKNEFKLFNINTHQMTSIGFSAFQCGNSFFNRDETMLKRIDIQGNIIWEYHIDGTFFDVYRSRNRPITIYNIFGVHNGLIWFVTINGILLGLDVETGDVKIQGSDLKENKHPLKHLPPYRQLDTIRGELIGFVDTRFARIRLNNCPMIQEYFDLSQTLKNYNIEADFGKIHIDKQYIYFCDTQEAKIGILNRDTLDVEWTYELDIEKKGISQILKMEVIGNRWYVHDRYNTLHVFEREIISL